MTLEQALADEAEAAEAIVEVAVISLICQDETHPHVRQVIQDTTRQVIDDVIRKTKIAMDLELQLQ